MKEILPTHEVIERCVALLKSAGFELRSASMRSEACYYGLPGRDELIRVAIHSKKKPHPGLIKVVTKITINGRHCDPTGEITINPEKIHGIVAGAIGRYMLACGRSSSVEQRASNAPAAGSIPAVRSTSLETV